MTFSRFLFASSLSLAIALPRPGAAQAVARSYPLPDIPSASTVLVTGVTATSSNEIAEGARQFIDGMSQRALAFLTDESLSQEKKTEEFRRLLESSFDMETIGRFALGRHWQVATPEQRQEYQKLFRRMVIKVYSDKFDEYRGEQFVTRNVRAENDRDIIVSSFIVPQKGPEVQVDWRVRYKKGSYRIVDVIVEGVSMTIMQRSDFSSVIQRGGGDVSVLLDYLKSRDAAP